MPLPPAPLFPTPFVTERVYQLGYGTGPWRREDLSALWGDTTADKFIRDAKAAGWLVSPQRGSYHVPPALDLMTVCWLEPTLRQEFLIARTLWAHKIKFWCLSSWCRDRGVDLGGSLFVTDLSGSTDATMPAASSGGAPRAGKTTPVSVAEPSMAARRDAAKTRGSRKSSLPFLDHLVIVPEMPQVVHPPEPRLFLAPVAPETETRAQMGQAMTAGVIGIFALGARLLTKEWPDLEVIDEVLNTDKQARGIPYTIGPDLTDTTWAIAFLAALGIARAEELALRLARQHPPDRTKLRQAAALIGPPEPNANWAESIRNGPFPYLLVPQILWQQMGADEAARRARTIDRITG